jgi:hypothetical protein
MPQVKHRYGGYVPKVEVQTALASKLTLKEKRQSRTQMRRAARIYAGRPTVLDRIITLPDKIWWLMIGVGLLLVGNAMGLAVLFLLGV